MNFTMGSLEEAKVAAAQADNVGGSFVTEPGAYAGVIKKASFKKFQSGAGGFEVQMDVKTEGEPDKVLKFMIITLTKEGVSTYKKDGKNFPLPGMNQIRGGLMAVLQMKTLPAVDDGEGGATYPVLAGRKIGCLVDIRLTSGKGNIVYKNPQIVAFYDPDTNQTGSEILSGKSEAKKKAKIEAGLKIIDDTVKQPADAHQGSDPFTDSSANDDPFAESNSNDDPFKESNEASNEESEETDTETSIDEEYSTQSE
jgi:hypothetical protein